MDACKVLIIDHQSKWVSLVSQILSHDGYEVMVANRGEKAIQVVVKEHPDIVLLEPFLSGEVDGFEVVRRIRNFSNTPIIILSVRSETEDILRGFEAGADDYIEKPFNSKILLARMRAVLNRCREKVTIPDKIKCGNIVVNQIAHTVTVDNEEIILTDTEYKLLLELAKNSNKVLLHEQLLSSVWGPEYKNDIVYLRSFIHTLRRKIEQDPSRPTQIINRSGIGYILVSEYSETVGK
jgi:two-component system, OmpR family, KDP operon response regulator KdpE